VGKVKIELTVPIPPPMSLPCSEDGIEVLTPGHFLVGYPLEALLINQINVHSLEMELVPVLHSSFLQQTSLGKVINVHLVKDGRTAACTQAQLSRCMTLLLPTE
jgi:hypothetical protein